jgi:hypothetical protein
MFHSRTVPGTQYATVQCDLTPPLFSLDVNESLLRITYDRNIDLEFDDPKATKHLQLLAF